MNRRHILLSTLGLATAASLPFAAGFAERLIAPAAAQDVPPDAISENDRVLGDPDAPVTIIEYSSLTCPHCAAFHGQTLPQIKENWINPGRASFVMRHFPLDQIAARAAMVANCFEGDTFFAFLDSLFATQRAWATSEDPIAALGQAARIAGMDQATFESCVQDESELNSILEGMLVGRDEVGVESTPSFLINGDLVRGNIGYERFNEALEEAEDNAST